MDEKNVVGFDITEDQEVLENFREMSANHREASILSLKEIRQNIYHRRQYNKRLDTIIIIDILSLVIYFALFLLLFVRL